MKKLAAGILAAAMVLCLAACGSGKEETKAPENKTETKEETKAPETDKAETEAKESVAEATKAAGGDTAGMTFGMSMNAMDEYQTEWYGYFEEMCNEQGIEVVMTNAEGKVDKQLADVESLIALNPDVILIRATDSAGVVSAFEACAEAGIPTIDSGFGSEYEDTLKMVQSQYALTVLQGELCLEWLEQNPDKTLKVGYLWGNQGQSATQERYDGWKETVEAKAADKLEILAEKVTNWDANNAMAAVEDWVQAFPEMNCIVCMSDELALAAVNVLQAAGIGTDECFVVGIDGSPAGQKAVREGTLAGTVYTSKRADVKLTIDYAIEVAKGNEHKGETIDPGLDISGMLTPDTIDQELERLDGNN